MSDILLQMTCWITAVALVTAIGYASWKLEDWRDRRRLRKLGYR